MARYWIIAPVESDPADQFNRVWDYDLAHEMITVGWGELGDISKMSKEELAQAVARYIPDKPPGTKGLLTNMLWAFYHEIRLGDFVIARRGLKILAAVGEVTKPARYSPAENPHIDHPNVLGISWRPSPRDKAFPNIVFLRPTLTEISAEKFQEFVEGEDRPPEGVEDTQAFVLEKYLQGFMVDHFDTIFKGSVRIYEDADAPGPQYQTDIGTIDILAVEPSTQSFVVIELKKGRSSDQVVGQILRYMGWVKENLCGTGQKVKGLIICHEPDLRLSYALKMINDIDVRYYKVSFKLSETP